MKLKFIILGLSLLLTGVPINAHSGWFWQNPLPQGNHLRDVDFANQNNGWAIGEAGTILFSSDGGNNWLPQTSGTDEHLYSISVLDQSRSWVVGRGGKILKTTDGGTNWINQNSGTNADLYSVYFINQNTGFVVGYDDIILKTTDGGTNWVNQPSGTNYIWLYSVFFIVCFQ